MQRGQVSFEYMATVGFLLLFSVGFFIYSILAANDAIASSKAKEFVETVAGYADFVAASGDGSSSVFEVDTPDNIQSIVFSGKQASLTINTGGGPSNFYSYSKANFTPATLSSTKGKRKITLTFNDGNITVVEG